MQLHQDLASQRGVNWCRADQLNAQVCVLRWTHFMRGHLSQQEHVIWSEPGGFVS